MLNIIRIDEVEKFTKIQHILSELSKKKKKSPPRCISKTYFCVSGFS